MSLRETNTDKLAHQKPDFLKTGPEKLSDNTKDTFDNAASYLPGQSKPRDALDGDARDPHPHRTDTGRGGLGTTFDALKPSSEQTYGEKAKIHADSAASHAQPNDQKSFATKAHDALTPGNDSGVTGRHDHVPTGEHHPVTGTTSDGHKGIGQVIKEKVDAVIHPGDHSHTHNH